MVDAADLKSAFRKEVWVRVPPSAPIVTHTCISGPACATPAWLSCLKGHGMVTRSRLLYPSTSRY